MTDLPCSPSIPGFPRFPGDGDGDTMLRFSMAEDQDGVTVALDGDLDIVTLPDAVLALELAIARGPRVTVDCARLRFTDAAALRLLRDERARARSAGGDLTLIRTRGAVRRLLDLTGARSLIAERTASCERARVIPGRAAVLTAAVATAARLAGTSMANLQLVDPARHQLRIAAQQGCGRPFLDYFRVVDDASSACGVALRTGVSVWVPDVARSPLYTPAAARVMLDAGAAAVASVPVRGRGGDLIAVISTHDKASRAWPDMTRRQLERLAGVTGSLI